MFKWKPGAAILFLSLVFIPMASNSQEVIVGVNMGYATFNMGDLKDIQRYLNYQYPVDTKVVESFPGYLNISANILLTKPGFVYGLNIGHTSTGGRISYRDYSGSLSSDQLVKMNYMGPMIAKEIAKKPNTSFYLGAQALLYFNRLYFKETIKIGSESVTSVQGFHSVNLSLGVFFEAQRRIKKLLLKSSIGGEVPIPSKLVYNGDSNLHLVNSSNNEVKLNASGLRINFGLAYFLDF